MADFDAALVSDATDFQTIDYVDDTPARDVALDAVPPAILPRRCVSSQELPRFSRTSLQ